METARRLDKLDEMDTLANRIGRLYPSSPWYLEAVIAAANRHLIDNATDLYAEPLLLSSFATRISPRVRARPACHWKATCGPLSASPAGCRRSMLRGAALRMFPSSDDASAALYFLGRLAQQSKDNATARAYYEEVAREYPNQYYATQARDRLVEVRAAQPASAVCRISSIDGVYFPSGARTREFVPNATGARDPHRAPPTCFDLGLDSRIGQSANCASARRPRISRIFWPWN